MIFFICTLDTNIKCGHRLWFRGVHRNVFCWYKIMPLKTACLWRKAFNLIVPYLNFMNAVGNTKNNKWWSRWQRETSFPLNRETCFACLRQVISYSKHCRCYGIFLENSAYFGVIDRWCKTKNIDNGALKGSLRGRTKDSISFARWTTLFIEPKNTVPGDKNFQRESKDVFLERSFWYWICVRRTCEENW